LRGGAKEFLSYADDAWFFLLHKIFFSIIKNSQLIDIDPGSFKKNHSGIQGGWRPILNLAWKRSGSTEGFRPQKILKQAPKYDTQKKYICVKISWQKDLKFSF